MAQDTDEGRGSRLLSEQGGAYPQGTFAAVGCREQSEPVFLALPTPTKVPKSQAERTGAMLMLGQIVTHTAPVLRSEITAPLGACLSVLTAGVRAGTVLASFKVEHG